MIIILRQFFPLREFASIPIALTISTRYSRRDIRHSFPRSYRAAMLTERVFARPAIRFQSYFLSSPFSISHTLEVVVSPWRALYSLFQKYQEPLRSVYRQSPYPVRAEHRSVTRGWFRSQWTRLSRAWRGLILRIQRKKISFSQSHPPLCLFPPCRARSALPAVSEIPSERRKLLELEREAHGGSRGIDCNIMIASSGKTILAPSPSCCKDNGPELKSGVMERWRRRRRRWRVVVVVIEMKSPEVLDCAVLVDWCSRKEQQDETVRRTRERCDFVGLLIGFLEVLEASRYEFSRWNM